MHPNLVNFGLEMARTVDEFLPTLYYIFSHWNTRPALLHGRYAYITGSRQTLARYVVARAYSLKQQNAGRAHAGLCHASSLHCYNSVQCINI